ncbi:hypothetical protein NB493_02610 [Vibrio alginolyticus]|nr:hypothetical protein [Vibrio alginolyticus]
MSGFDIETIGEMLETSTDSSFLDYMEAELWFETDDQEINKLMESIRGILEEIPSMSYSQRQKRIITEISHLMI